MFRAFRNIGRLLTILRTLARHDALAALGVAPGFSARLALRILAGSRLKGVASLPAGERLALALQALGPAFIKLGQALSVRSDLIGEEVAEDLSALQDRLPPFSGDEARRTIELELGREMDELFASFDDTPVAAASIAQVHRATLVGGEQVVFKVRRPGILKQVRSDLSILQLLINRMVVEYPDTTFFDPDGILREFERALECEMDFAQEAANIRQFEDNFAGDPCVRIPRVVSSLTTSAVLCMEFLDGVRIREAREAGFDMKLVGERYLDMNYRMMLHQGFFHGDLHPGNVLVLPGEVIGLLDFGMTGRLTKEMQNDLVSMIFALERGDFRTVARIFYDNGIKTGRVDYPAFERDCVELIHRNWQGSIKDVQVGRFLTELAQGAIHHRVRTPHAFTMFFKALLTTEGLAKSLIPEVDPLETARPYVEKLVTERFSPARLKEDLFYNLVTASSLLNRLPTTVSQLMDDLDQQRLHMSVQVAEDEATQAARRRGERRLAYTLLACTGFICGTTSLFLDAPTLGGHRILPILFFSGGLLALARVALGRRGR